MTSVITLTMMMVMMFRPEETARARGMLRMDGRGAGCSGCGVARTVVPVHRNEMIVVVVDHGVKERYHVSNS